MAARNSTGSALPALPHPPSQSSSAPRGIPMEKLDPMGKQEQENPGKPVTGTDVCSLCYFTPPTFVSTELSRRPPKSPSLPLLPGDGAAAVAAVRLVPSGPCCCCVLAFWDWYSTKPHHPRGRAATALHPPSVSQVGALPHHRQGRTGCSAPRPRLPATALTSPNRG